MPSTLHAARASNPSIQHLVREELHRLGLVQDAARITVHADRDAFTIAYPGYSPITITGLDTIQAGSASAIIAHKLTDMLHKPVI